MKHFFLAAIALTMTALTACNNETLDIGSSLTQQRDKLTVSATDYEVTTRTVLADSVLLRSSYCYLGNVKDPETGAYITSGFMTQFNILESFTLPSQQLVLKRHNDLAAADSCRLEFYMEEPTGITDTLAAIKIRIAEMNRPMEENRRYYSNFDPAAEGYLRNAAEGGIYTDKMFSYRDLTLKDTVLNKSGYYNFINVRLNQPYTDAHGETYNNYGTYIMQQYYRHPEYFKNSYTFVHNVCPGVYVSVVDGEGLYTVIPDACIRVYYRTMENDTVYSSAIALAGTEEVLQTTKISNEQQSLDQLLSNNTCTYLKAPAGLFTEVTLPVDDIYKGHDRDTVMTARINFQRINNDYLDEAFYTPNYMLMVHKDSLTTFFENKKSPDSHTSFYTTFQSNTNLYPFSNISSIITTMAAAKRAGMANDPNWTANHPNWNKVLLVPVQIITSSNSTTITTAASTFEHCASIASTRLVGGSQNPYPPIKLSIVYGSFGND